MKLFDRHRNLFKTYQLDLSDKTINHAVLTKFNKKHEMKNIKVSQPGVVLNVRQKNMEESILFYMKESNAFILKTPSE